MQFASWSQPTTAIAADFPMLFVEGSLMVQTLGNLVANCMKYSAAKTTIIIAARVVAAGAG